MRQTMTVRPIERICLISLTPLLAVNRTVEVPDAGTYMTKTKRGGHDACEERNRGSWSGRAHVDWSSLGLLI